MCLQSTRDTCPGTWGFLGLCLMLPPQLICFLSIAKVLIALNNSQTHLTCTTDFSSPCPQFLHLLPQEQV